jgi:putative membrane-bound dehydrogenase-like protein
MPRRLAAAAVLAAAAALAVPFGIRPSESRAQVAPEDTLKSFTVADGLQATVWATEPMLVNPTNIDVDHRGRVWVAEGANYRGSVTRPEGDRIVILEDTDGDGTADSSKVFTQDPSLFSPLGITVLGNKVYVAQSPSMLVYTIDETGDKPVGKPEVLFTGFTGENHDHGLHSITFGPDGRFYFNAGNDGCGAREPIKAGGKPVVDSLGSDVPRGKRWRGADRKPGILGYTQGMAFRCNPDGTGFETLGFNFRNNYEVAPDSFGTAWQSDNDDDGNESVRINYVMEGGNFGFVGPKGHDWARDQAAFPDQTKQQAHWHQKWPGIVPNMLHTGGGSPTGILVYEGDLLPEAFRGALIHCDPGPNVVRAYVPTRSAQVPVKKFNEENPLQGPDKEGAGYKAEVIDIVRGSDTWFRPSDVCVAPDGSLFVADWYDPGVGGHATGDKPNGSQGLRGRIYRVAPSGHRMVVPRLDLGSVDGQIAALKSPNIATRYLAYTKLRAAGDAAVTALRKLADADPNPRFRARALWLLARTGSGQEAVAKALKDGDVDIRITGLRAARLIGMDVPAIARGMVAGETSPAVLREIALAMNYQPAETAVPILVELANKFDGEDRWYLEAIGIGAIGKEDALLAAWERDGKNKNGKAGEMLRWRLRMEMPAQARLDDTVQPLGEWWAAGPFDGGSEGAAGDPLGTDFGPDASPAAIDLGAELAGIAGKPVKWERIEADPYDGTLAGLRCVDFVAFCEARDARAINVVGYFAANVVSPVEQPAQLVLGSNDGVKVWLNGRVVLDNDASRSLRYGDDTVDLKLARGPNVLLVKLRQREGKSGLVATIRAAERKVAFSQDMPAPDRVASADAASDQAVDADAEADVLKTKDGAALPPIERLAKLTGDAQAGARVFADAAGANCISCHQIGNQGRMLGPPLSTIGQKLSKAQLYEAILKPSAGILMGFENWVVRTKKGVTVSGLKTSDTFDGITIKDTEGKYHDILADDISRQVKQAVSIMPDGLAATMTQRELVDLVEYLSTLRNK